MAGGGEERAERQLSRALYVNLNLCDGKSSSLFDATDRKALQKTIKRKEERERV